MKCSVLVASNAILGLAALGADATSPSRSMPGFPAGAGIHETEADAQSLLAPQDASQTPALPGVEQLRTPIAPTRSSFMASWQKINGAIGYRLDVSTDASFRAFVDGYQDLDVGNVTGRAVTGLSRGTIYYYRVRAYDTTGSGSYSEATKITTEPTTGLIIHATFDSSITGNPNAATIEAMINRAISIYESLFSDPITIQILFRYSITAPNGTHLPAGVVAQSNWPYYAIPSNTFIDVARADATTNNDFLASSSLDYGLSIHITPSSANGRALGLNTPPEMFANGTIGNGGPYDGIVTLNSAQRLQFTRPTNSGNFDAQRATEHEIDEVMGLGSHLNLPGVYGDDLRPQDLFSWSAAGGRNYSSNGIRYLSINRGSTNIVNFNQNSTGDFGDWLSSSCPQAHPYVQNAFACTGQSSDVTATSAEAINLDVIGYDLAGASGLVIPDTTSRGMVFDFAGQNLYISTSSGLIKAFNLSTRSLMRTYNLGGSLNGIDIARDSSFILAAQYNVNTSVGTLQRLNLTTGTITNLHYPLEFGEGGGYDVAISSNGLGLVTTVGGGGRTPLRQIDLNTNAITIRTDGPGEVTSARIHRSADGTLFLFMEDDGSIGPVFTYSGTTNTFGPRFYTQAHLSYATGAVDRVGNLIGLHTYGTLASLRTASDFSVVHSFNGLDSGIAFDPVRDVFYGVNSTTNQIIAYSTTTYAELFRLIIGEDVGQSTYQFGAGTLVASADGRWIAIQTYSGIRVFKILDASPATDFNRDTKPDYVLFNGSTRRTAIWYLNNNVFATGAYGPIIPTGWSLVDVADANQDGKPDYVLFNGSTHRTAIWYMNNNVLAVGTYGPTIPAGWSLVAVGDLNRDGRPDYVLFNGSTRQTMIWYLDNSVFVSGASGPTLPSSWQLAGVADFNRDGKPDYLLFNPSTRQTAIWYMNDNLYVSYAFGPTVSAGYTLTGAADFNGDFKPDYTLFNPSTGQSLIWYLDNNAYVSSANGPTLPAGWNLARP